MTTSIKPYDIVIPVYNKYDLFKRCVNGLMNTIISPEFAKRLIVVDDNSSEWSSKNYQDYKLLLDTNNFFKEHIYIRNGNHQWFTRTVNRGLKLTKERYIFIINSDCVFQHSWLEEMFNLMEDTSAALVGSDYRAYHNERYRQLNKDEYVTGHCWLLDRTKTINSIGLFEEESEHTVHYGSDSDYCYRLHDINYPVILSYKSMVLHDGTHPSAREITSNDNELNERSKQDFLNNKLD
jgi:GT2 family glycosyltransferase